MASNNWQNYNFTNSDLDTVLGTVWQGSTYMSLSMANANICVPSESVKKYTFDLVLTSNIWTNSSFMSSELDLRPIMPVSDGIWP